MNGLIEHILNDENVMSEFDIKKAAKTAAITGLVGGAALLSLPSSQFLSPSDKETATKKDVPLSKTQDVVPPISKQTVVDISKVIQIESSGNPRAVNRRTGARGLMQIMKATWEEMVGKMGKDWDWNDAFDPDKNIAVGTYYLEIEIPRLLRHFSVFDSVKTRLAAYNYGIGNVSRLYKKYDEDWIDHIPTETSNYITKYNRL